MKVGATMSIKVNEGLLGTSLNPKVRGAYTGFLYEEMVAIKQDTCLVL